MAQVVEHAIFLPKTLLLSFIFDRGSPLLPKHGRERFSVSQHDLIFPTPYTLPYTLCLTLPYTLAYLIPYLIPYTLPYTLRLLSLRIIPSPRAQDHNPIINNKIWNPLVISL